MSSCSCSADEMNKESHINETLETVIKNGEIILSDAPENHFLPVDRENPFLLPPVMEVLFKHMDQSQKTLRSARQVCRVWNNELLPVFREKSTAVISLRDVCNNECPKRRLNRVICSQFLSTMENREEEEPPFTGLRIENMDIECMTEVFSLYGSHLTSLVINFRPNDEDTVSGLFFRPVDLKQILLNWCKNLQTLDLKNLPFTVSTMEEDFFSAENSSSLTASKVTHLKWSDDRPAMGSVTVADNFVIHFVRIMPLLEKVEVYFDNDNSLEGFTHGLVQADAKGYVSNLNSLKFKDTDSSLRLCCGSNLRNLFAEIMIGYE